MRSGLSALLATVLALLLAACQPTSPPFNATDMSQATGIGGPLALTDHHGKTRTLSDFAGKTVFVFFGYTQCPDVCPTTLSKMQQVVDQLGADATKLQVIFVTVDPERDTRELLAQYVPSFHPDFLGLYGNDAQVAQAAKDFRIFYRKQPGSGGHYSVDHSTGSYVIDARGKLRLYVRHEASAEQITEDLRRLIRGE